MNTIRSIRLLIAVTIATLFGIATVPAQPSGQWDFNSGNLNATVGSALQYSDGPGGLTELGTAFNSTTTFGIPNINGTAASVMRFPAATNTMGYYMPAPLAGNGGGGLVNDYTIIFDLLYPTAGTVRPLLDTDGGVFVQGAELSANAGNGIGVTPNGPFDGTIAANTWYRVGFSIRAISSTETEIHKYINGLEVGSQVNNGSAQGWGTDGRLAMTPAGVAPILANSVGAATLGYVNSIQLRDVPLNAGQMEALGGPSAAGIPQVIPPVPSFVQSRSPALNATGVSPQPAINVVLHQGDTTINSSSIQLSLDGANLPTTVTPNSPTFTATANVASILDPSSVHSLRVVWTDSVAGSRTSTWSFTVQPYQVVNLPGPFFLETFDTVAETAFPTGWYETNNTQTDVPGLDLNNPRSDSYKSWVVITTNTLNTAKGTDPLAVPPILVNGTFLTSIANNQLCYAESDSRNGSQVQMLFATNINCTGRSNVFLSFHSIYGQNQDNIASVEYSVNGGVNWLPVVYMLDDENQTADVIRTNSVVDVGATFNTARADQAYGTSYGTYIGAPVSAALIPFVSGRINDNLVESIRVEMYRLPQADNKPNVSLRFMQAGTASWWFAVDDVGLYEITTPVFTTQPQSAIIAAGTSTNFTVGVSSPTAVTYQWQHAGTNISDGGHYSGVTTATLTVSNASTNEVGSYRCKVTNTSGPATSNPATLDVIGAPLIILQPVSQSVNAGVNVAFNALARGRPPLVYQWTKGGVPIAAATTTTYAIPNAQSGNAGLYACVISNSDAVVTSSVVSLKIIASITTDLVVHLKFDADFNDSSGHGNHGTAVGAPTLVAGKIGQCMQYTDADSGASLNYVTLGIPPELHMGSNVSFSISFWYKVAAGDRRGDPAMVSNKDWDSGGNTGFTIWSQGDGFRWNYTEVSEAINANSRKDSGSTGPTIEDGNWHHCVVTFNRGGNAGTYVDGNLRHVGPLTSPNLTYGGFFWPTTIDNDPPNPRTRTATGAWNIGEDGSGLYTTVGGGHDGPGISVTNAAIDDVGIWRRTLTPGEVQAIYAAGNAGNALDTAAPVTNPRPLDPSIAVSGSSVAITKGNTILMSAPSISGPWTEVTGARGTNVYREVPVNQKYFRGSQP